MRVYLYASICMCKHVCISKNNNKYLYQSNFIFHLDQLTNQRQIQIMNNKLNFFPSAHFINKSKLQSVKYQQKQQKPTLANLMNQYTQNQHHNINLKLNSHVPKIHIEMKQNSKPFPYRKTNYQEQRYDQNLYMNLSQKKTSLSTFNIHKKQNQKINTYKAKTFAECLKQIQMQKGRQQKNQDSQQNHKYLSKNNNSRSPFRTQQNMYAPQLSPFTTGLSNINKPKARLKDDELVFKAKGYDNKFVNFAQLARRYNNDKQEESTGTAQQNKILISQGFNTKLKSKQSVQRQYQQQDDYQNIILEHPTQNFKIGIPPLADKPKNNNLGSKKNSVPRETIKQNMQLDNNRILQSRSIEEMKKKANREIQQFARNMFEQKKIKKLLEEQNIVQKQQSPKSVVNHDDDQQDEEQQKQEINNENLNKNKFFSFQKQFKSHNLKNVDSLKRLHNNLNAIIQEQKSSYFVAEGSKENYALADQKNNKDAENGAQNINLSGWLKPAESIIYNNNNLKTENQEIGKFKNLFKQISYNQYPEVSLKESEGIQQLSNSIPQKQDLNNKNVTQQEQKQKIQQQLRQIQMFAQQQMRRKQEQDQDERLLEQKIKLHRQKEEQKKVRQLQYQKKLELEKKKSSLFSSESQEIQSLHSSKQQPYSKKINRDYRKQQPQYQYRDDQNSEEEEQLNIQEEAESCFRRSQMNLKFSFEQKNQEIKQQFMQVENQGKNELEEKVKRQLEQQYQTFQMKKKSRSKQQIDSSEIPWKNKTNIPIRNHDSQKQQNAQIEFNKKMNSNVDDQSQFRSSWRLDSQKKVQGQEST